MPETIGLEVRRDAPISTWFGVGGLADRLALPATPEQLAQCVALDPHCRVLGDGANLLVADAGVRELVVDMGAMRGVSYGPEGIVRVQAGAKLHRLVQETAARGLAGLHTLAGVPASIGGAVAMNAGGKHGSTYDHLVELTTIDRQGVVRTEPARAFAAGYRDGALGGRIVVEALFRLTPDDPAALRERVKAIMLEKKHSQPLAADSAGCAFKNPVLQEPIAGVGRAGQRVGAGLLIDRAGCKGWAVGGASVSERHANFITVDKKQAAAADIIELIERVRGAVRDRFGITLHTEVVVWGAS